MHLNDDIVDIEKTYEIYSPTIVLNGFSGSFLHPSVFSIKHSRSGALSNFLHIEALLISLKRYRNLYLHIPFHERHACFSCKRMKAIQTIKITVIFRRNFS